MDPERERIQSDLRGLIDGEVRCDDIFVQLHASDASIYEIRPVAVVRPRGTADVVACVQYASEKSLPVHARGAGTTVAGHALGPGIVLDFSQSMRRILQVDGDRVRVQPGVVHAQLNRHLRSWKRLYGPDPATRSVTTLGSVLALDAGGSHWPQYGSARDRIDSLQVVLADGSVATLGRHAIHGPASGDSAGGVRQLVARVAELLQREEALLRQAAPRTRVNHAGYNVFDVLRDGQLDLARLLVGSEGTLAIITEATLITDPIPKYRGVMLLSFDRLESAAHAALLLSREGISACDLMDRRILTLCREADVRYDLLIPRDAEAMLLVEKEGDDEREVRAQLAKLMDRLLRVERLAFDARSTLEVEERNLYWRLARRAVPTLSRLKGSSRPVPFVEELAVPPESLPDFLVRVQNVLKTHQVTSTFYAHAATGQLHLRPFLDLMRSEDVRKMQALAADLFQAALEFGGTISGERGDGLSRTWYVPQQFGPVYDVFREVKRIFDPQNIFNPGKVVADVPQPPTKNLRALITEAELLEASGQPPASLKAPRLPPFVPQLNWSLAELAATARDCNGCGRCRSQSPEDRMCPIFRIAPREEASPRAKANLLRGILSGRLERSLLAADALKAVADLCVNCHQCRLECPAGVDIPRLVQETKAQHVATNGLSQSDWFLTRLEGISAWASLFAGFVNWSFRNRQMRWLMERFFGIAQGRKLPRLAPRSFLRTAHRRRLTRPVRRGSAKVLYFVDLYANHYDVQLAEALVAVLQHNKIAVYVPSGQVQASMASLSLGAVEHARKFAARNVPLLAEAVRQGYHIVTTEPAAALALTHEYCRLMEDDDARLVAAHTSEACTYLWRQHQAGNLELDLKPINADVGYHLPCHLRALGVGTPGQNLLRLIPGLMVHELDRGCSGMAGTYGLKRENYRNSLRAGWALISSMRDTRIQAGATECSTCKLQMEQGTTKPTIHPVKLLALAYGIMPELSNLLARRGEELIVT